MIFRYYTNAVSNATKPLAKGIFVVGLLLTGFGILVYVLREVFAVIAAAIFIAAGFGCCFTAIKIFWQSRKFQQKINDTTTAYRKNVRIHTETK